MSSVGALSWILSGELAGRALPSSCLHVQSGTELSESFLQPKGPPVPFPVAGLCSLPITWFGEFMAGHRSGQCGCESRTDAVTP